MLPTNIGRLFMNKVFEGTKIELGQYEDAMSDFQKAALTQEFETTLLLFHPWLQDEPPTDHQQKLMKNLYELTKLESRGNLVQMVVEIYKDSSSSSSNKLEAIRLLDALLEGKEVIDEEGAAKLIIKLAEPKDDD